MPRRPLRYAGPTVTIFTSRPYAVEVLDEMSADFGNFRWAPWTRSDDEMESIFAIDSGELRNALITYTNWPLLVDDERIESIFEIDSGTLRDVLIVYTNWRDAPGMIEEERIESAFFVDSGTLVAALVSYVNWPDLVDDERIEASFTIDSGTLT